MQMLDATVSSARQSASTELIAGMAGAGSAWEGAQAPGPDADPKRTSKGSGTEGQFCPGSAADLCESAQKGVPLTHENGANV